MYSARRTNFVGMYMVIAFSKDLASNMVHNIEYRGRGVVTPNGSPNTDWHSIVSISVGFPIYKLSVQLETLNLLSIRRY